MCKDNYIVISVNEDCLELLNVQNIPRASNNKTNQNKKYLNQNRPWMWTKAIQISRLEQFNIFNCELENITNHNSFSKLTE